LIALADGVDGKKSQKRETGVKFGGRRASCCRAAEGRKARKARSSHRREEQLGDPSAAEGRWQEESKALTARIALIALTDGVGSGEKSRKR
jgi:hypothetical protein